MNPLDIAVASITAIAVIAATVLVIWQKKSK